MCHFTWIPITILIASFSAPMTASWEPTLGPPETPRTLQDYRIEGFKGALHGSPMMPRDASLGCSPAPGVDVPGLGGKFTDPIPGMGNLAPAWAGLCCNR